MSLASVYDERYAGSYRKSLWGYEIARWKALEHFIRHVARVSDSKSVLDYGAGRGLHVALWESAFPQAELTFCEISATAIAKFKEDFPRYGDRCHLVCDDRAEITGQQFEVVVSVEVMEHVEDLTEYLSDIYRLLAPGGRFIWTTPCSNSLSIEHIYGRLTGKIDATKEGYRRWRWEEPTHLRRLRSVEAEERLKQIGFTDIDFRFRSHFFSFFVSKLPTRVLKRLGQPLMYLDYSLLRRLPNGASMIGVARKPA